LRVVSVQSKVAQAHKQMEMLRQAADGGIQVARMVVMNYLAARQDLPPLDDIYLDNGIKVEISCPAALRCPRIPGSRRLPFFWPCHGRLDLNPLYWAAGIRRKFSLDLFWRALP
jgi:hypothetical protein